MKLTRALMPAAIVGALLVTGCSAGGGPAKDAAGEDCLATGDTAKAVAVEGTTGEDLKLTSKTPVSVSKMERAVLKEGEGDVIEEGQQIGVTMTMFNGADGEAIQQQPESPVSFAKDSLNSWAYEGFRCAVPGQQVALLAPFDEMFPGTTADQLGVQGLSEDDSIVVVMDFGKIEQVLEKAEGTPKEAPKGFPKVELDEKTGEPTITIPKGEAAPKKLEVATLIEGDGEKVEEGDTVTVNYRGVIWRTGEEFDSSWSRGAPASFSTTGVIGGFSEALVGQTVGSQVISIVPADDGGYGAEQLKQMGHEGDDVMVFVLDILSTSHAQ